MVSRSESWIKGLNTLVSNTQIKPNELSDAIDIQLVEDGKVQCPRDGQAVYGSTWSDVTGYTYTAGLDVEAVQAYDRLYLANGTDPLTYYDGSNIISFTAITAPGAPTATRTGTDGTYTYSYKITAVTAVGETLPSAAGTQTCNASKLDTSTYMTVAWSAVTNAIGYNVWGRKDSQWYFMAYVEGNGSVSYVDKGQDTPTESFIPPEANTTGGVIGKYIEMYKNTLFVFGDPNSPTRLYYSGGGDKINDFSINGGGGFIDVSKNDGQMGTGLKVFKDSLLVFKDRSIYKFSFTSASLPQIEQVNSSVGAINQRSIVAVENDVFFASDRGIFTIGNEAGFAFDVLRTNELSAKVRSVFQSIESTRLNKIAAVYATKANTNLVIYSYTPSGGTKNSDAIVYDRERLAWYQWTNIGANCWTQYYDSSNEMHVLYGDDSGDSVNEILTGTDDFGSAIHGHFKTWADTAKAGEQYKALKNVHLMIRKPSGSIKVNIIKDGVTTAQTVTLSTQSPTINFGHYTFKDFLLGESYGTGSATEQNTNMVRRITNVNQLGRSFMLEFDNNNTSARFTLLGIVMEMRPKSIHFYGDSEVVN